VTTVRYAASKGQGFVTVDGVTFQPGQERDVDPDLADELLSGQSERLEGFKFEAVNGYQQESTTGSDT
jgi:hypothetical protein